MVNATAKFGGVELDIHVHEPALGFHRNIFALKDALVRCLGCIIPFDGSIANAFFGNQFEKWLKEDTTLLWYDSWL